MCVYYKSIAYVDKVVEKLFFTKSYVGHVK